MDLLNSATHIFFHLKHLTISDREGIVVVSCPNQIKNNHFVTSCPSRNSNICICMVPFPKDRKCCCLYYYPIRNHHNHFTSPRTICNWPSARPISTNIPHKRQVPDALWSMKQIEISILILSYQIIIPCLLTACWYISGKVYH